MWTTLFHHALLPLSGEDSQWIQHRERFGKDPCFKSLAGKEYYATRKRTIVCNVVTILVESTSTWPLKKNRRHLVSTVHVHVFDIR